MPEIIGGIPLRMRSIQVNIDKPNFMINPTNCSAFTVASQGIGDQGTVVNFSSPFNAVNCATLPFKPKMSVAQLGGRKSTKRARDPSLHFDLNTRPGDANIKSVAVTLPTALEIDQRHLGNLCSENRTRRHPLRRAPGDRHRDDETPLLEKPSPVPSMRSRAQGGLPHLAFILNGQVTVVPRAETETIAGDRLQTTVPVVPDAPIGHFHLTLFGGKHGYLANTRDLCSKAPVVEVALEAQNGRSRTQRLKVKASCAAAKHRPRPHRR